MDNISGGGGYHDLKLLWVQYDFNNVQLSGRGRKELPLIRLWEKTLTKIVCSNCFNLHVAKPFLSQQCFFKPMTNEGTIDRIANNTFEEIDAFSKLVVIFDIF